MITFLLSVAALVAGYFIYSKVVEKVFGADASRPTPAHTLADGVDFVVLPGWKMFLIQFLNIAGLGPIFGAVAGALWGPVAFVWIVLGSIFAGGVHDYFSGMLSVRHGGESITEITGRYLGRGAKQFMRLFSVVLLLLVGAVFIIGPAKILHNMTSSWMTEAWWVALIFVYYFLSTVLPIDQLIGRIYPLFGSALLFMAVGIGGMMFARELPIPELTLHSFTNQHNGGAAFPVFPMLFLTIACGAISGFHATQSPMMARCMSNEKQGRRVFYGAMITEGVVALIWAAISMSFFGGVKELNGVMSSNGGNAALVVNEIANSLLGRVGAVLALLGVVAAPITSGDTAFRSARLIIADLLKYEQRPLLNRLWISVPLFVAGFGLTLVDFAVVWRYFAFSNQALATVVLWVVTAYLVRERKPYIIALVPALFMTVVVVSYILIAPEGLRLPLPVGYTAGFLMAAVGLTWTVITIYRGSLRLQRVPVGGEK
ncbi:MAG TPA: carbon starvation protein A [Chitinophagaceae bacterium]